MRIVSHAAKALLKLAHSQRKTFKSNTKKQQNGSKKRRLHLLLTVRCDKLLPDRMAPNKNWWASKRTNASTWQARCRSVWAAVMVGTATTTTSCYEQKNAQSTSRNPINHLQFTTEQCKQIAAERTIKSNKTENNSTRAVRVIFFLFFFCSLSSFSVSFDDR